VASRRTSWVNNDAWFLLFTDAPTTYSVNMF
jgi:hypothetical protein